MQRSDCRRPRFSTHVLLAGAALAATALSSGCAITKTPREGIDYNQLPDDLFVAYLAEEPLVSVEEAYRAVLILADGQDGGTTFEERKQILESRDIARAAWKLQPQQVIDEGSAAYMVCKVLQLKGGIDRIIFGSWGPGDRRYAHRELVYRGILDQSGMDYTPMTGPAFSGLISRADEKMQERGLYEMEEVDLGAEPAPGEPLGSDAGG